MERDRSADWEELWAMFEQVARDARDDIGILNIIIAGRTGVGKSTLINAVFHGQLADTGQGEPVTKGTRKYTKKGIPLAVYDTRGLEMEGYQEILDCLERTVIAKNMSEDATQHIHCAWVCVSEGSRRVEKPEVKLHKRMAQHMPVLGVITQAKSNTGFRDDVQRLLPEAKNVVRVLAMAERLDGGHVIQPHGLGKLVQATAEMLTEGSMPMGNSEATWKAFAAAQKVSVDLKKQAARKVMAASVGSAAFTGAAPIPFADAPVLVAIQMGMLAGISKIFGVEASKNLLRVLVVAMAGPVGAAFLGRAIVANLLKLVPGAGSVAGGAIAGTTAAALTAMLGKTYIAVLAKLCSASETEAPSPEAIAIEFKDHLARRR